MVECLIAVQKYILPILQNSGHFLGQYGQYYDCLDLRPELKYNFIKFAQKDTTVDIGTSLGLCLPAQC